MTEYSIANKGEIFLTFILIIILFSLIDMIKGIKVHPIEIILVAIAFSFIFIRVEEKQ